MEYIKNVKTKMDMRHTFIIHNEMFITLPFFHSTMKGLWSASSLTLPKMLSAELPWKMLFLRERFPTLST